MNTRNCLALVAFALLSAGAVRSGWSASFSVAPVRVLLDEKQRTERLAVKNESIRPLTLLIKGYRWTQTVAGIDRYDETADLIIFPRSMTVAAEEERFIRIGITSPPGVQEKAFRIYMEEQPGTEELATGGATGRILMRVGIPIFAQPRKLQPSLKISELYSAKGRFGFTLLNGGNSFVMAEEITITGLDTNGVKVFAKNLGGFYLLAGSARTFEDAFPKDQCRSVTRISVTTRNEGKEEQNTLNIPISACEF